MLCAQSNLVKSFLIGKINLRNYQIKEELTSCVEKRVPEGGVAPL
jgi:hypothetical protein